MLSILGIMQKAKASHSFLKNLFFQKETQVMMIFGVFASLINYRAKTTILKCTVIRTNKHSSTSPTVLVLLSQTGILNLDTP